MKGHASNKADLKNRLLRIEGQVRGIERMVGADRYCIDVLTQINSVTAALRMVGLGLLDQHVRRCVVDSINQGEGEAKIDELVAAVQRFS